MSTTSEYAYGPPPPHSGGANEEGQVVQAAVADEERRAKTVTPGPGPATLAGQAYPVPMIAPVPEGPGTPRPPESRDPYRSR